MRIGKTTSMAIFVGAVFAVGGGVILASHSTATSVAAGGVCDTATPITALKGATPVAVQGGIAVSQLERYRHGTDERNFTTLTTAGGLTKQGLGLGMEERPLDLPVDLVVSFGAFPYASVRTSTMPIANDPMKEAVFTARTIFIDAKTGAYLGQQAFVEGCWS